MMDINELITRTEYTVLTLPEFEDTLRSVSSDIPHDLLGSMKIKTFAQNLYQSMMKVEIEPGWMHTGVAAIQVGVPLNIFLAYNGNRDEYIPYINPEVELLGGRTDDKDEACLSIPNIVGKVRRTKRVRIKYFDLDGELQRKKLSGWNARVVQHEFDHLRGILFTDKLIED